MVAFNFNADGYVFETGLKNIRAAYDASLASLNDLIAQVEHRHLLQEMAVATGADPYVREDDGTPLHHYGQVYELELDDAHDSLRTAQTAFIVILHHFWERQCDKWMESDKNYDAKRAYSYLEARGLTIDRAELEILRKASNTIKHNSDQLYKSNRELFDFMAGKRPQPNYEATLKVTDAFIDRLFTAVRNSGPTIHSPALRVAKEVQPIA